MKNGIVMFSFTKELFKLCRQVWNYYGSIVTKQHWKIMKGNMELLGFYYPEFDHIVRLPSYRFGSKPPPYNNKNRKTEPCRYTQRELASLRNHVGILNVSLKIQI